MCIYGLLKHTHIHNSSDLPFAFLHLFQSLGQHFSKRLRQKHVCYWGSNGQTSHQDVGQVFVESTFTNRKKNTTSRLQSIVMQMIRLIAQPQIYPGIWRKVRWCCRCERLRSTCRCPGSSGRWDRAPLCRCRPHRRTWWSQICRPSLMPEPENADLWKSLCIIMTTALTFIKRPWSAVDFMTFKSNS